MAGSPKWKVYDPDGVYMASTKEVAGAALLMSLYGEGSTIRLAHRMVVWTEGVDGNGAESYDGTAEVIAQRVPMGVLVA